MEGTLGCRNRLHALAWTGSSTHHGRRGTEQDEDIAKPPHFAPDMCRNPPPSYHDVTPIVREFEPDTHTALTCDLSLNSTPASRGDHERASYQKGLLIGQ